MAELKEGQTQDEQRRFLRLPFVSDLSLQSNANETSRATIRDIGRGGVAVSMGRYLRPGRWVLLSVEGVENAPLELKAQIAWCRPVAESRAFEAGLRVVQDEPDTLGRMSRLLYQAVAQWETGLAAAKPAAHAGVAAAPTPICWLPRIAGVTCAASAILGMTIV